MSDNPPLSETWTTLSKRVFTPVPSELIPGSFRTYLELKTGAMTGTALEDHSKHCPSVACGAEALCCTECKHLIFTSKAALDRHRKICHDTSNKRKRAEGHTCTFDGCDLTFPTNYQLAKHKKPKDTCARGVGLVRSNSRDSRTHEQHDCSYNSKCREQCYEHIAYQTLLKDTLHL